ncbi:ammonium transporter [Pseudomonas aeruginosa]|uniref:ammonium transporter n=1 Tax=Pseudomonas aeruginosa TaxID=287 RepID=UPI000B4C8579|nr:ammonium transporter [Pseudomonas aeruginosa]ASD20410.1 ammonia channel protein [Pseudomonas aeruginosa]MCG7079580.1 ammonium transporter [Pseudomonas aeruginosa]MCG7087057.1 ammonium transporter [Pseudomonas aeruginosa]MCG7092820.1 ammonium transporter [Pseudomonas aeruginosa]MCG7098878.1 ammonium transporter [Pseudomonas aeruginosa]
MIRFSHVSRSILGLSLLFGSVAALAEETPPAINSGDTAFVALCSLVVLLMTLPGLALFYGGMARTKNVLSILMQVFCTASLMSVLFAIYGYSLAFTDGGSLQSVIGGLDKLFMQGVTKNSVVGTIPEYLYFLFMLLFAAITPALIVGGFAERMKFSAVMVFMAIWLTINYIPMAHMAWGGGWVFNLGVQDFAGGNVVHLNVGIAALVGAWLLGRRRGFGTPTLAPHNMTMTLTGGSLLWVGWLGFCGGCALAANGFAMMVMVNTMLASCTGALGWMLVEWQHRGRPSMFGAVSGAIAGLVAITPACGYVGPMGAILLGLIAGPVCVWSVDKLKPMIGLDDAFDVFGVHGVAGILGGLLTPVFALAVIGGQGFAEGRDLASQLLVNGGVILFSVLFSGITSLIAFKGAAALCGGLRVDAEAEVDGLDLSAHGEVGYKYSN